ncbi:MAG: hypothetical protein IJT39_05840 [Bacteroidales bacterium]|nr:hypothetical protein [Bacteroidales bacterium]
MRKFNLNWGVVLAAVVLLGYSYISFLGMLYKVDGVLWKAVLFAIGVIAAVSICVYVMVSAKVTKSKEAGVIGQIVFGIIILATFLVSGSPFTSFLKVAGSKNAIETGINNVKTSAYSLDEEYNKYALERVQKYGNTFAVADGDLKVQSLKRRLSPDSINTVQQLRRDWVAQIGDMSIWNVKLPQNLKYMQQCVGNWTENYTLISDKIYESEHASAFSYNEFDTSLNLLMDSFKKAGYSFWAVLVAIFSAFVMMIPYWLAVPTSTRKTHGVTYVKQVNR